MKVSEVQIDDEYILVKSDDTITSVSKAIASAGIPDVVVLDSNDRVVGCIDDYDIVSKIIAEEKNPNEVKAEEIMYAPPYVKLNNELKEVQEIMKKLEVSMLPITDEEKKLLGVVTMMDILEGLAFEEYESLGFIGRLKQLLF